MTTPECLTRLELKEYLSGWSDEAVAEQIEAHLASCTDCEQTIVEIENEPETLLELVEAAGKADSHAAESPIAQAVRAAKLHVPAADPALPTRTSHWPMLGKEVAGYELLRPLGRGGMGTVYVAKHRKLGKEVAIKLLPAEAFRDPHFASRFQREMRAAGGLEHPSIVRATDAGEEGDIHYLVMELVDGLDLSRVCRLTVRQEIADACEVMRQVALGLAFAHSQGVVHRDIKPSNIVLSREGTAKLLDFGLARTELWDEVSAELTSVGQLMGTIDYMAPEQAERPETVDYRADLYALGTTLFRILTGRAPLSISPSVSPLAKLRLLAMHEPPRIDSLRDDVPSDLVELISELLARNPDQRPPSANHVAERLAGFSSGSDLRSLVVRAVDAAESSEASDEPVAGALMLQPSDDSQARLLPEQPVVGPDSVRSSSHSGNGGRILTLASFIGIALAGLFFTLETQKGQLVIQSDVPGVTVQVKQDGKLARELTVENGVSATRLWVGKYEVVLGAGSDSVQLVDDSVNILRGETQIARIELKKPTTGPAPPGVAVPLRPGEVLRINSRKWADLSNLKATVMADATMKLPLVGTISVEGRNVEQLEAVLNERYAKYLKDPAVEVFRDDLPNVASVQPSPSAGRFIPPASTAPLQPGDALHVSCLQESSIDRRVVVQADHTIRAALVGTVAVKGKTIAQLEEDLTVRYGKFIRKPQIQVFRDFTVVTSSWVQFGAPDNLQTANSQLSGSQPNYSQPTRLAGPADDEPMYDSRTLSEWLELLRRERSASALHDVFEALTALASESTSERITHAILDVVPERTASTLVFNGKVSRALDSVAFQLLRKANPGRDYYDLLQQELSSDRRLDWKNRIASKGIVGGDPQLDEIADLDAWLRKNVLLGSQLQELKPQVIIAYRSIAQATYTDSKVATLLIESLELIDKSNEFWLKRDPEGRFDSRGNLGPNESPRTFVFWNPMWAKTVASYAMDALRNTETSRQYIVQAERILHFLCCADRDSEFGIDRTEIADWLKKRTAGLTTKELLSKVRLSTPTPNFMRGLVGVGAVSLRLRLSGRDKESEIETLVLIELANATLPAEEMQQFAEKLLRRIEPTFFNMNFAATPDTPVLEYRKVTAEIEFETLEPRRDEYPFATPERWIALIVTDQIYERMDTTRRRAFKTRMSSAQQERWFASRVGKEHSDAKTFKINYQTAKELLAELSDAVDARNSLGIGWDDLCVQFDRDDDEMLDASEFVSLYLELKAPMPPIETAYVDWAKKVIGKYDENEDGALTEDEWEKMLVKPNRADSNGDGIITVWEYAHYRKNR